MIFTTISKDGLYQSKDKVLDEAQSLVAQKELAIMLRGSKLDPSRKARLDKFLGLSDGDMTVTEGVPQKR